MQIVIRTYRYLSPTLFNKITGIFLPFTIEKRSHMKHERTEGQQPIFVKEKNRIMNAQAMLPTLITTLVNSLSLVTGQVII